MNTAKGKEILSLARGADFAHAGEEEAIDLVLEHLRPFNSHSRIMDVGCGRGGTAERMRRTTGARVAGFDIDSESIGYASNAYPLVDFRTCDIRDVANSFPSNAFDLITAFNVLFCLSVEDRICGLRSLRSIATNSANFAIFDYYLPDQERAIPADRLDWHPWHAEELKLEAEQSGWKLCEIQDCSERYFEWYTNLLHRIEVAKEKIVASAGRDWYERTIKRYGELVADIKSKKLAGGIFTLCPTAS